MNVDLIILSLNEIKRFADENKTFNSKLDNFITKGKYDVLVDFIKYDELYDYLKKANLSGLLIRQDKEIKKIDKDFFRLLVIHYLISKSTFAFDTIIKIEKRIESENGLNLLSKQVNLVSLFIIYQSFFDNVKWIDFAHSVDFDDWYAINALDEALPYVSIQANDIFYFIENTVAKHPDDLALPMLAKNIRQKIVSDKKLNDEISKSINYIIQNDRLKSFLPSFLNGLINDAQKFDEYVSLLLSKDTSNNTFIILDALGKACPNSNACTERFLQIIKDKKNTLEISPSEYVRLHNIKNVISEGIISYIIILSEATNNTEDINAIIQFLNNNIDLHEQQWYTEITHHIILKSHTEVINPLSHLLRQIFSKDHSMVFSLLTKRFESIGDTDFIDINLSNLTSSGHEVFKQYLTFWFNSDNPNVHRALNKLCINKTSEASLFSLSQDTLSHLSYVDKFYIASKIVGFVFSKDILQNLMISLAESIKEKEEALLEGVFDMFNQYVIYNYRSTLDLLKQRLNDNNLPKHILKLYQDLITGYDQYFEQLRSIKSFPELLPSSHLIQHIQFYQQQLLSKSYQEASKGSWLDMFKEVSLHSKKWAIRREGKSLHEVSPLALIEHSTEFPSGERLNPVLQMKMRRTYQYIKRDEININ